MSLGNLYFRNTRLLVLTIALIVVAGLAAFTLLPRREDPRITPRFGLVLTPYPGASAERVEALVTEKIEEELREIEEIAVVESDSRPGISAIRIELDDSVPEHETGEIWSRVRDQLDDVRPQLPAAALDPDFSDQETDAFALIVALTWRRDGPVAPAVLQRLSEELEHEIQLDNGTEETELFGANREEIVVEIDPSRIAALGLTAGRIAQAVRESDAKVSAGLLRSEQSRLVIEVEGEFETLTRLRRTPIRYGEGDAVVRLDEIATVRKTVAEPATELAFVDGLPAISIGVRMKLDQRIDKFAATMRELLRKFEKRLPRGVTLDVVFDQSTYTEARLDNLFANLGLGALFVVLVIFFMMGWRSAILVAAALPLTSLMVLAGLNMLGVPIHQMSVTGLIIALGLLIDNAIVMVDEVSHRRQDGAPAGEAVRYAVSKLALPLLGSTLTTVFAFMPLVLMPGPAGEFVGTIAVSVILSILSSLFLAVTIIPALTGLFGASAEKRGFLHQGFSSAKLTGMYRATLDVLFRRPWLALVLALILPTAGFVVGQDLEEQFFPPTDRDQFPIEIRLASHASLDQTKNTALAVRERLLQYDQVDRVHFYVGASAQKFYYNLLEGEDGNATYAQALVQLKTWKGASALLRRIQHDLDREFPGVQTIVKQLEQGPPFAAPIEVRVVGPDPDLLFALGEKLRGELIQVPGVTHTRSSLTAGTPKLVVRTDEEKANRAGYSHLALASRLRETLEGAVGGSLVEGTEELPVRVRVGHGSRSRLDRIASLELSQDESVWTPLSAVGEITLDPVIANLPRRDGRRVNTVQGFLEAGLLPAPALAEFQRRIESVGLPEGYTLELGGEASERDDAVGKLLGSVVMLLVLMVATMVLSFGSFRIAGLIGFVAVACVGLALGALWIFDFPFGFMAIVGTMGLVGVAINDSIVVLAAVRDDEKARTGDPAAIRDVVVRSSRHVFATTITTIAGFLPLLLDGGRFWPPLAIAIAGGVAGATILALYFAPAAYRIVACPRIAK